MNENTALFIFDFDGTLVKGHSHNYIGERLGGLIARNIQNRFFSSYDERAKEIARLEQIFSIDLMKEFLADENLGWKNEEQIARLFKNIVLSGHKNAIASFNAYHYAVKYALEQLLGKEDAAKVYIKSKLPADSVEKIQLCDKVPYIKEIMSNTEIMNKANVFFMDDTKKHTDAAKDYGIIAVLVKNKGIEHIHKAFNFLYEFNEQHEIYVELKEPATEPLSDKEKTYLSSEAIKAISFDPISKEDYSDGEHTEWGNVPMLGNGNG